MNTTIRISKKAARYRASSTWDRRCHVCKYMVLHGNSPATCKKVTGVVRRQDVCDLFEKKT